jgi:hypothetical protein
VIPALPGRQPRSAPSGQMLSSLKRSSARSSVRSMPPLQRNEQKTSGVLAGGCYTFDDGRMEKWRAVEVLMGTWCLTMGACIRCVEGRFGGIHFARGPDRHRELATPLQHDQAPRLNRIQATSTRGVRARIRRVAGCATQTGSAGHAGETANLKRTFHLDHSAGADETQH